MVFARDDSFFNEQFREDNDERNDRLRLKREAALRRRRPAGECAYCDRDGDDPMMPRHTASERCESGKRPHCTCDTCF